MEKDKRGLEPYFGVGIDVVQGKTSYFNQRLPWQLQIGHVTWISVSHNVHHNLYYCNIMHDNLNFKNDF
jgi:hypothetical protein